MKLDQKLVPKAAPCDDPLFNRRLLAYYGLIFSVYWNHLVLAAYVYLAKSGVGSDPALIALLGVPTTIAGLGFWKYLKAAEKDDDNKSQSNNDTSRSDPAVGNSVDNRPPMD